MARRVLMEEVSGGCVRGRSRLDGWRDDGLRQQWHKSGESRCICR